MALKLINIDSFPAYLALSTDVVENKVDGVILVGKTIFLTDTGAWKIITEGDGTVADFLFPAVAV